MPLWKPHKRTKKNLKRIRNHNIKTEIRAGRPPKQAIAIAYAVERRAKKRKR